MTNPEPSPIALMLAAMAPLLHRPVSEAAHRLTDDLYTLTVGWEEAHHPRVRKRRLDDQESLRSTIAAVTRDLLKASRSTRSEGWCYRPARNTDFTGTQAAARQYAAVRKAWEAEGLLDYVEGIRHGLEWDGEVINPGGKLSGRAPRLRATPRLLAMAEAHGITPENLKGHYKASHDRTYPVTLERSPRFKRTPESDAVAERVRKHNAFLDGFTYSPDTDPVLVARYNEDPSRPGELAWGGRLYTPGEGGYQSWPKAERLRLRISGQPVAEVDIGASFLTIFLSQRGIRPPPGGDAYSLVPGVHREVVKGLVTASFGKVDFRRKRWPDGLAASYAKKTGQDLKSDYQLQDTIERILTVIPALEALPRTRMGWGLLQRIEAGILLDVMTTLREWEGIPTLPVHDALIVPERHMGRAAWALYQRFYGVTGTYPRLTISRASEPEELWSLETHGNGITRQDSGSERG